MLKREIAMRMFLVTLVLLAVMIALTMGACAPMQIDRYKPWAHIEYPSDTLRRADVGFQGYRLSWLWYDPTDTTSCMEVLIQDTTQRSRWSAGPYCWRRARDSVRQDTSGVR